MAKKRKSRWWEKNKKSLIVVGILVLSLPWTIGLAQTAWKWVTGAYFRPATIVVSVDKGQGQLRNIWSGVSQGFEKPLDSDLRMSKVSGLMKSVGVKYVRIDHLYDGYGVVSRVDGRLAYDWSRLDRIVGDIISAGALPYFSISYMPDTISKSDILDLPREWGEWGQVVAALVGHYSRDYKGGLNNVIYEVWNEPDLFGGWKMYGDKSYPQMYSVASNAAVSVRGAKPFQIGGPATTGFYPAWVKGFYQKLDEQVRIDFFSWHRYSAEVEDFVDDATTASEMIAPEITRAQSLYISEWGVNPERSSSYDGRWAAAHYLAVNRALVGTGIDMALTFEVQDGPHAEEKYHGGWGMLTHEKFGAIEKKPRFRAMEMLSEMSGTRLLVSGEGDYVTAMAARGADRVIRVMAVNYDKSGSHQEVFPLTLSGLGNTTYEVTERYLSGRVVKNSILVDGGNLRREIALSPSDAVLISVERKSK